MLHIPHNLEKPYKLCDFFQQVLNQEMARIRSQRVPSWLTPQLFQIGTLLNRQNHMQKKVKNYDFRRKIIDEGVERA